MQSDVFEQESNVLELRLLADSSVDRFLVVLQ